MDELITIKELCNLLKISRQTVTNMRKEGMPFQKFGKLVRFNKDEVYKWLKTREVRKR